MRQALLRRLLEGDNRTQAAAALGISIRAIQRYVRKHEEFDLKIRDAIRLRRSGKGSGPEARELLESEGLLEELRAELRAEISVVSPPRQGGFEQVEPAVPEEDLPELPAAGPPVVTEAEVVELVPTGSGPAGSGRGGRDPFEGLEPFGELELVALSWRLVKDPKTPAGIHAAHTRGLYGYFSRQARRSLLQQLGSRASGAPEASRPVERGLTKMAVARFRRELIGPPPEDEEDEDVA
jgi:hypothetical protein